MRLPTLVIASFSNSCQADIVDIKKFLARHASEDLIAGTRLAERLARLRQTLWDQWCRMDAAWQNHNPLDGNVGMEILAGLEKIVEATRVAVDGVLQTSKDPPTTWRQQQISNDAGGGATHTAEIVPIAAVTEDNGDKTETVLDVHCGGAAIVARRVHIDIIDDNDNLLAKQKVEYVADDVAESGDWTLAKTVETRFFETIEESYKTGRYGILGPREWDKERFHGVEKPMLTDTLAVQWEYASLKREENAERACSGTFPDQKYDNRSVKKTFGSEILPFNTERP
jgi:hypothetical protein